MGIPGNPALQNIHRLHWLRWIAIAGQLAAIGITHRLLGMALPLAPLLATVLVLALFNAATTWRLHACRGRWPGSDPELVVQLLVDVLALSVLLYFTGGSTNPFVSLYLLPIAIAAALVRPAYVWFLAGVTSLCYSFLLGWYVPLPHFHGLHGLPGQDGRFSLHVIGMWFTFMVAAVLMASFVVRMASTLRARDRQLAAVREAQLRNEQLVGLGTLAAGAAHELGTPLSTIAVLARELELATAGDAALQQDVQAIRSQVERCKGILGRLSGMAGQSRAEGGRALPLDAALEALAEQWRLLRPATALQCRLQGSGPVPAVVLDLTLQQALHNLLNNAADASPLAVTLDAQWDAAAVQLVILDRGPGLDAEVLARAGEPFFSTKGGEGIGIGVFLANATIERLGGTVQFANREGGGAVVTVRIPCQSIEVVA